MARTKLVRDRCGAVLDGQCKPAATEAEYKMALILKAHEEIQEIANDPSDPAEYADLLEVLRALVLINCVDFDDIKEEFFAKREELGTFEQGQIWTEIYI